MGSQPQHLILRGSRAGCRIFSLKLILCAGLILLLAMEVRTREAKHFKDSRRRRFFLGHSAAIDIALPNNEKHQSLNYLDQYSCKPPPIFLITLSFTQIGVFVYETLLLSGEGQTVGPNGPAYIQGPLIFNPHMKSQLWRYLTYMFVHSGYFHITFNVLIQLMLGLPLELVHRWWRILFIYLRK